MTLGIFVVASRKDQGGDTYHESIQCYEDLADKVVVYDKSWPKEFSWEHIGQTFQKAYESIDTDWVIHADLDYIFHEQDFDAIRKACHQYIESPALSFWKYQFILPDRYNLKSRLVIAVNKGKYGNRIRFDSGGDLCQPSLDGKYLSPDDVQEARIPFYNYEKISKTKEQIKDDCGRMERAALRLNGETRYKSDGTDEDAYNKWYEVQKGKIAKPQQYLPLEKHPKYMQKLINELTPEQFGYDGFGLIEGKVYV